MLPSASAHALGFRDAVSEGALPAAKLPCAVWSMGVGILDAPQKWAALYHPSPRISPITPMQHGLSGPGSTGLDKAQRWCETRPCFDTLVRDNTGDDQGLAPAGIGGSSRISVMVTRRLAAI